MNDTFTYIGPIMGKPRMTKADAWKGRDAVNKYWAIKDLMILQANLQKFELSDQIDIIAHMPIPKSWSKKKKLAMVGMPHKQVPDGDNILKLCQDVLRKEDSGIWDARIRKYWSLDPTETETIIKIKNI